MPRKKDPNAEPAKMGRPEFVVDWETVEKLLHFLPTNEEVADFLHCDFDTLNKHCLKDKGVSFSEFKRQNMAKTKISLRRKQIEVANSGNPVMLIWLGKQMLGQTDKVESNTQINQTLAISVEAIRKALLDDSFVEAHISKKEIEE